MSYMCTISGTLGDELTAKVRQALGDDDGVTSIRATFSIVVEGHIPPTADIEGEARVVEALRSAIGGEPGVERAEFAGACVRAELKESASSGA